MHKLIVLLTAALSVSGCGGLPFIIDARFMVISDGRNDVAQIDFPTQAMCQAVVSAAPSGTARCRLTTLNKEMPVQADVSVRADKTVVDAHFASMEQCGRNLAPYGVALSKPCELKTPRK